MAAGCRQPASSIKLANKRPAAWLPLCFKFNLAGSKNLCGRQGLSRTFHAGQGHLKDRRAMTLQRPATHPATIVVIIDGNHLIDVVVTEETDAVPLMHAHESDAIEFMVPHAAGKTSSG